MDFWSVCSFLRVRRFESYFETSFRQSDKPAPQQKAAAAVAVQKRNAEDWYEDDDRFSTVILSVLRIVVCFMAMMVTTAVWAVVMVVLLPWPYERVRQGNLYGHVTGRMLMWILGNPITIEGSEYANTRASPAEKRHKLEPAAEAVRRAIYFTSTSTGDERDQETHDPNQLAD